MDANKQQRVMRHRSLGKDPVEALQTLSPFLDIQVSATCFA
jgi:hypothetical protein